MSALDTAVGETHQGMLQIQQLGAEMLSFSFISSCSQIKMFTCYGFRGYAMIGQLFLTVISL